MKKGRTYNVIKNLPDAKLKEAYKELKAGSLQKDSLVRKLQSELFHENKSNHVGTVPLGSVKYHIAMEMLERFYEEK